MVSDDDHIIYCGCAVPKLHNQWSKMGMYITNWALINMSSATRANCRNLWSNPVN